MGKLFEYGQRFNLRSSEILNEWVGVDISKYFNFYLDMAMRVLKGWQYKDVENYEEFVSEVFSQFSDLAGKFEFQFYWICRIYKFLMVTSIMLIQRLNICCVKII